MYVVATTSRRNARSSRLRGRLLLCVAAGCATLGVSSCGSGADVESTRAVPATPSTDVQTVATVSGPVPDGMEAVGDEHGPRGYVRAFSAGGAPIDLPLGSERRVAGQEVVDGSGELVGYFLTSLGFVDLETAADPSAIDALIDEHDLLVAQHGGTAPGR